MNGSRFSTRRCIEGWVAVAAQAKVKLEAGPRWRWISEQPSLRRVPVVILSSSKQTSDINRAYELGANSCLVKPIGFEALVDMARNLYRYWFGMNEKPPTCGVSL